MKKKFFLLFSAIGGVILLIVIFHFAGIRQVFSQAKEIGFLGAGAFILNAFLIILVASLSWRLILKAYGYHLPFKDILAAKLIGLMVSYLTPSMYIGGEPLRTYIISKKHDLPFTKIGATVVVDKFLELGAGLSFIYLGSIFTLVEYSLPPQIYFPLLAVNILWGLGMGFIFVSFIFKNKIFTRMVTSLGRINPLSNILRKIIPRISKIEGEVFLAFKEHRWTTLIAFLINLLSAFLILLKPAIFFYFLKIPLGLSQLALLFALTHLILALQLTPGGLGIFELGAVGIYQLIGIGPEKALAFSLMVRATDLVGLSVAILLIIHFGLKKFWKKRE